MNKAMMLGITGMTCNHCALMVENALCAVPGVALAQVAFPKGQAQIEVSELVSMEVLAAAINKAGYGVSLPENAGTPVAMEAKNAHATGLHVAIIGSGSSAFAAAIRVTEGGGRVTMIESGTLGGTCVNVGCVPSKIMIRAAQMAQWQRAHPFRGLSHSVPDVDRAVLVQQQQDRVAELREAKYAHVLTTHPDITFVQGHARFVDATTLVVRAVDGSEQRLQADRFLIAAGAHAHCPDIEGLAQTPYWTSTEALVASELPRHLLVVGGAVVAVELAQAFRRLGCAVTLLARSTLLSKDDPALGVGLEAVFQEEGIRVLKHTVPTSVHYEKDQFLVSIGAETIHADRLLVATGRTPNTADLGLEQIGVITDKSGAILVDAHMQSSVPHIYAAGDCTTHPQFVYVAAAGGTRAAINLLGGDASLDLRVLPVVVFTDPQVATVGLDERTAAQQGFTTDSRTLTLDNVPRALANFDTRGFIKLIADKHTGKLLGAQILAAEGGEIIQAATLAIRGGLGIQDLADQLFPYLTMVEGLKLCAQTFTKDVSQLSCCAG